MPDVNGYIRIAQRNVGTYLDTVQPDIIAVIADVGGFSTIPILAEKINGYLRAWSTGSNDNKKLALAAIESLENAVGDNKASCR